MTTIGKTTHVVTLQTAPPAITIKGPVDAYGTVATYDLDNTLTPLAAAIFGRDTKYFTLTNTGLITSNATSATDSGILLAAPARLTNKGTIIAASGITMLDNHKNNADLPAGTITNSRLIEATLGTGIYLKGKGQITNTGTIAAPEGNAIDNAGLVINTAHGTIAAGDTAISNVNQLFNYGKITGGSLAVGLGFGYFYNSGHIEGGVSLTEATAFNYGTIHATTGSLSSAIEGKWSQIYNAGVVSADWAALYVVDGAIHNTGTAIGLTTLGVGTQAYHGVIYNNAGATLSGGYSGVAALFSTIVNDGLIAGPTLGLIAGNSELINSGTILGGISLVMIDAANTIIDSGVIDANGYNAITLRSDGLPVGSNLLQLEPGARITGAIDMSQTTFEVTNPSNTTLFTATALSGAGTITVGATGNLTITGETIGGAITNNAAITVAAHGDLTLDGTFHTPGTVALASHATLTLAPTAPTTPSIDFVGTNATLILPTPANITGPIQNFAPGDTIDLPNIPRSAITVKTFADDILTLTANAATYHLTFAAPTADTFTLTEAGAGTAITLKKPAMAFLTPTTPPEPATLPTPTPPPATTQPATSLSAPHLGIAAALLHPTPTPPTITLHP